MSSVIDGENLKKKLALAKQSMYKQRNGEQMGGEYSRQTKLNMFE